jgi:hypothetical protein
MVAAVRTGAGDEVQHAAFSLFLELFRDSLYYPAHASTSRWWWRASSHRHSTSMPLEVTALIGFSPGERGNLRIRRERGVLTFGRTARVCCRTAPMPPGPTDPTGFILQREVARRHRGASESHQSPASLPPPLTTGGCSSASRSASPSSLALIDNDDAGLIPRRTRDLRACWIPATNVLQSLPTLQRGSAKLSDADWRKRRGGESRRSGIWWPPTGGAHHRPAEDRAGGAPSRVS